MSQYEQILLQDSFPYQYAVLPVAVTFIKVPSLVAVPFIKVPSVVAVPFIQVPSVAAVPGHYSSRAPHGRSSSPAETDRPKAQLQCRLRPVQLYGGLTQLICRLQLLQLKCYLHSANFHVAFTPNNKFFFAFTRHNVHVISKTLLLSLSSTLGITLLFFFFYPAHLAKLYCCLYPAHLT